MRIRGRLEDAIQLAFELVTEAAVGQGLMRERSPKTGKTMMVKPGIAVEPADGHCRYFEPVSWQARRAALHNARRA